MTFLVVVFSLWLFISLFFYPIFSKEVLYNLVMSTFAITTKHFSRNKVLSYILASSFLCLLSIRCLYSAFWKFPEFSGLIIAGSVHILCHGHLELIYHPRLGYFVILLYEVVWCSTAVYSGFVKSAPPPDIIFTLFTFFILQIIWYRYRIAKDYEEIESKLLLEVKKDNIQSLISSIPEGIVVMDQYFQILMINPSYSKLKCDIPELKILQNLSRKQKETGKFLMECIKEFNESQQTTTIFGVCSHHDFYIECTGSKTKWNNQPALVITLREVSNIINLQNTVNLTSKTLKILQGVSHELKTPLNQLINGHEEALHSPSEYSESTRLHIKKSLSISYYLLSLIRDMIDFSHYKFNNLCLTPSVISAQEAVDECIPILQGMNPCCSISFSRNTQDLRICTDKYRLKQCLLSLGSLSMG